MDFAEDLRGDVIVPPAKKLEDLIHLTELCVDLLQQNEEHYAEVSEKPITILLSHSNFYNNNKTISTNLFFSVLVLR